MKSVSWILVLCLLAVGCAETSVVENTEDQTTNKPAESVDDAQAETADDAPDESDDVAEAPAESTDDEPVVEEVTPQQKLADLRERKASVDEYIVFIEEQAGSELSLNALSTLARNKGMSAEDKGKLSDVITNQFITNEEIDEATSFDAARILFRLLESESADGVMRKLFARFADGEEGLNNNVIELVSVAFTSGSREYKKEVGENLVANYADDERIVDMLSQLNRRPPGAHTPDFLKSLAEKSTNKDVQGNALMSLVSFHKSMANVKPRLSDPGLVKRLPADLVDYLNDYDVEAHSDEITAIYERIVSDFADVKGARGRTLGAVAENELFVMNHLSIGKTAPDIVGEDLDGEEFKLSDYRGKVVLLDFWGDW